MHIWECVCVAVCVSVLLSVCFSQTIPDIPGRGVQSFQCVVPQHKCFRGRMCLMKPATFSTYECLSWNIFPSQTALKKWDIQCRCLSSAAVLWLLIHNHSIASMQHVKVCIRPLWTWPNTVWRLMLCMKHLTVEQISLLKHNIESRWHGLTGNSHLSGHISSARPLQLQGDGQSAWEEDLVCSPDVSLEPLNHLKHADMNAHCILRHPGAR